jgi:xylulokinase
MSYMGLDVGQTGCKAVVFGEKGDQLGSAYREYKTLFPEEGWAEIDSREVRDGCFAVMREAQAACPEDPVRGLAVSTMGEAFTPVDRDGRCLANAMITFDTRTREIAGQWSRRFGIDKLYGLTGHTAHPMFSLFKLLWLKDNRPGVWDRAVKFLCFEDFIHHALGLEPRISWSLAGRTMMFNVKSHRWEPEILDAVGIRESKLAVPVPSGTPLGLVPKDTALSLGFSGEVIVASGGHDQPMGALGAGVIDSGKAMYATGTSECITPAFPEPVMSDGLMKNNLCTYDYTIAGMYTTASFSLTGGNILRWFRDEWGEPEVSEAERRGVNAYEILLSRIGDSPSGLLVLPYFTPSGTPYFETDLPGVIYGLRLSTRREQLLRALLEGVAFEMKLNLDILDRSGIRIEELRPIGGGAKSRVWVQLKADVLNRPMTTVHVTEAACFAGAMFACSAHTGEPIQSIVKRWVKTADVITPNPENARAYEEQFHTYRRMYPALKRMTADER